MFGQKQTFRKAALEKLASPERLDEMMRVTSPIGWIALTACITLLSIGVTWSIFATVPEKVTGQGILVPGGAFISVESGQTGMITKLHVKVGDIVQRGDIVADIGTEEIGSEIFFEGERLKTLRTADAENARMEIDRLAKKEEDWKSRRAAVEANQAGAKAAVEDAERKWRAATEANAKIPGTYAANDITARELAVQQASTKLEDLQAELSTIKSEEERLRARTKTDQELRTLDIKSLQMEIDKLAEKLEGSQHIRSNNTGLVEEIPQSVGANIGSPQETILRLRALDQELRALIYVGIGPAKKIPSPKKSEEMDEVWSSQISPSTVKKEKFGAIRGKVLSISPVSATREEMLNALGSDVVVDEIIGGGPQVKVDIALKPREPAKPRDEAETQSLFGRLISRIDARLREKLGKEPRKPKPIEEKKEEPRGAFEWTSGEGPAVEVTSGTMCSVTIVVGRKRPIEYAKKWLSLGG